MEFPSLQPPMSLAKIPLTFAFCLAFEKCVTPPNPPPAKDDARIPSNMMEMTWYTQQAQFYALVTELSTRARRTTDRNLQATSMVCWARGNSDNIRLELPIIDTKSCACLACSENRKPRAASFIDSHFNRLLYDDNWNLHQAHSIPILFHFEVSIQKDHQLITSGPYSIVRHPGYTGLLVTHPAWFLWQFGKGSWVRESGLWDTVIGKVVVLSFATVVILGTLYLVLERMSREDEALKKHFGKKWEEWASRVRYSVIPGIW